MASMSRYATRREFFLRESLFLDLSECVLRPGLAATALEPLAGRILGVRDGREEC
jgi:hypothetical protein